MTVTQKFLDYETVSLKKGLEILEIPVLYDDDVEAHKRAMLKGCRTGIWRWFHILPQAYVRFTDFLSENFFFKLASICIAVMAGGAIGILFGPAFAAPFVSAIVGTIAFALIWIYLTRSPTLAHFQHRLAVRRFLEAGKYWQVFSFERWRYAGARIPEHAVERAERIREMYPEADIIVERFGSDPLIAIVRDSEKVYFGAWNTGTHLDNI